MIVSKVFDSDDEKIAGDRFRDTDSSEWIRK